MSTHSTPAPIREEDSMNAPTVEIRASRLAALVRPVIPLAEKDGYLPALNGVLIESSGAYLTASATDRYRIGISRVLPEVDPPAGVGFLIRLDTLHQLLRVFKPTKTVDSILTLTVESPDRLRVEQSGGMDFIDASMTFGIAPASTFPDIRTIIGTTLADDTEPATTFGVNASYLADFRHAASASTPLIVRTSRQNKPIIVTAGEDFIGAIMPVKSSTGEIVAAEHWAEFLKVAEKPKPKPRAKTKAAA